MEGGGDSVSTIVVVGCRSLFSMLIFFYCFFVLPWVYGRRRCCAVGEKLEKCQALRQGELTVVVASCAGCDKGHWRSVRRMASRDLVFFAVGEDHPLSWLLVQRKTRFCTVARWMVIAVVVARCRGRDCWWSGWR